MGKRDQNPITAALVSAGTFVGSGPGRLRVAEVSPRGVIRVAGSGIVHAQMLALVRNRDRTGPRFGRGGPANPSELRRLRRLEFGWCLDTEGVGAGGVSPRSRNC
jgi:hypothetical protein